MNKKGFTLVELLMVIVLIGIVGVILTPNIIGLVDKSNSNACNSLKDNILAATKMYVMENKYEMGFDCGDNTVQNISISQLVNGGYLKETVVNPKTKEDIDLNTHVTVAYDCTKKEFNYNFKFKC